MHPLIEDIDTLLKNTLEDDTNYIAVLNIP